jgi:hypothetical protein
VNESELLSLLEKVPARGYTFSNGLVAPAGTLCRCFFLSRAEMPRWLSAETRRALARRSDASIPRIGAPDVA